MSSTDDARAYADELARACHAALGGVCRGVILHGSLAQGGHVPGTSDVDLLLVVDDALTDDAFRALEYSVRRFERSAPGQVDIHVTTSELAATPIQLPPVEAILEIRRDRRLHLERNRPHDRDLVVELWACRDHGVALAGAEAQDLIGEIPDAWVMNVGLAVVDDWIVIGDDPEHAVLTVLTACRIWRFSKERLYSSKDGAAEWALEQDPSLAVVRHAIELRHRRRDDPLDPVAVADLLAKVRARLSSTES